MTQEEATIRVAPCKHGQMLYFPHDKFIGGSLDRYGEYCELELAEVLRHVKPGDIVIEVGSNIGTLTIPLARAVGNAGRVLAFEPQRVLFQMLCGNAAMNGLWNILAFNSAVGAEMGTVGVPAMDYTKEGNFGGCSLLGAGDVAEVVPLIPTDKYDLERVDLLKLDCEGMELAVLQGAKNTIRRCQPVIYCENDRVEFDRALVSYLTHGLGYACYWHVTRLFNPANARENAENVFDHISTINMLCLPTHVDVLPHPDLPSAETVTLRMLMHGTGEAAMNAIQQLFKLDAHADVVHADGTMN